jgi:uracil-DNA glycosylase family 4
MMGGEDREIDQAAVTAALAWWLDAGVDAAVTEEPRDWLKAKMPVPEAAPASTSLHEDLSAFRHWLSNEPGLPLDRAGAKRVLPHGAEGAEVMLLSEMPGRDDGEQPIGGEAWALAVRMLAAIGIEPDQAYGASLACFAAPGAKLSEGEAAVCADIARRHIALAKPKRLILFGDAPARALLGEPLARARGRIHKVEGVRTIATFHPRWLLQRPGDKALAWRDLLLLMEEER